MVNKEKERLGETMSNINVALSSLIDAIESNIETAVVPGETQIQTVIRFKNIVEELEYAKYYLSREL